MYVGKFRTESVMGLRYIVCRFYLTKICFRLILRIVLCILTCLVISYIIFAWKYLNIMNHCITDVPTSLPSAWKIADDSLQECDTSGKHNKVNTTIEKWTNYFLKLTAKFKPELYHVNTSYGCDDMFPDGFVSNIHRVLNYKIMRNAPCIEEFVTNKTKEKDLSFPVIVTGSSSNHFYETQALLWSIQTVLKPLFPNIKVVLYDLGFTESELKRMKNYCNCEVRQFNFNSFPEHVKDITNIAWKPLVILETIYEFDYIMWVDASIRFKGSKGDWDKLLGKARATGILLQTNPRWKVNDQTKPDTFQFLGEPECLFGYPELESGWILLHRNWFTLNVIVRPWCGCALTEHCLTHPFPSYLRSCSKDLWKFLMNTRCHRFDQSVLNIILIRIFNKYRRLVEFDRTFLGDIERGNTMHLF